MFICLGTCRYTMSKMWRNFSLCVEPSLWPWWSLHDTTISIHQFHNSLLSGKCLLWSEKLLNILTLSLSLFCWYLYLFILIYSSEIGLHFHEDFPKRRRNHLLWRCTMPEHKFASTTSHMSLGFCSLKISSMSYVIENGWYIINMPKY